jgi:hypothetical protein
VDAYQGAWPAEAVDEVDWHRNVSCICARRSAGG